MSRPLHSKNGKRPIFRFGLEHLEDRSCDFWDMAILKFYQKQPVSTTKTACPSQVLRRTVKVFLTHSYVRFLRINNDDEADAP